MPRNWLNSKRAGQDESEPIFRWPVDPGQESVWDYPRPPRAERVGRVREEAVVVVVQFRLDRMGSRRQRAAGLQETGNRSRGAKLRFSAAYVPSAACTLACSTGSGSAPDPRPTVARSPRSQL